jgi:hypothetical protein
MRIIKASQPADRFVMLGNAIAQDPHISSRALGLLVRLLSYPDGWQTDSRTLAAKYPEGRDAIRKALNELETAGHLERVKYQNAAGQWQTVVYVYAEVVEKPVNNSATYPQPRPDNQASVNQAL